MSRQNGKQADIAVIAPNSVEAEEALLGAVLINPEAYVWVHGLVEVADFFIVRHGWIWDAIARLHARREAIDNLTVAEELRRVGQLEEAGGPAYLTRLITLTPTSIHADAYAQVVARAALRRRLLAYAGEVAKLAHDEALETPVLMERVYQDMLTLDDARAAGGGLQPFRRALDNLYAQLETRYAAPERTHNFATGFTDLDKHLGGVEPDEFVLIAARPGVGKSIMLMNIAEHAVRTGKVVALFSLEMADIQLARRALSGASGVNSHGLRTGRVTADEYTRAMGGLTRLNDELGDNLYIDHRGGLTPAQIRAEALRLRALRGRVDAVLIDYTQLIKVLDRNKRYEEVTAISIAMKALAREMNCPVIAAAQLSRALEQRGEKRPQLSDLRDSGQLEQDADIVLGLYLDAMYDRDTADVNVLEVIVLKFRNGPTGTVKLFFDRNAMRFRDLETRRVDLATL